MSERWPSWRKPIVGTRPMPWRPASSSPQLRDCPHGLHAAIALVRSTSASKSGRSCGDAAETACRCAVTVLSSPRATGPGQRGRGAELDPVVHGLPHERCEQAARLRRLEAGVARDLLRHRLERDQEVRRHGRGGVVGRALVVGQLERDHPERLRDRPRCLQRLGGRAGDGAADPAQVGRAVPGERLEGVEPEDVRAAACGRAQGRERGGAARVPDQARASRDGLRGCRDLRVGDAEQDRVAVGNLAAPGRARRLRSRPPAARLTAPCRDGPFRQFRVSWW